MNVPAGRGVYPGSFDPPTIAHVAIAEAAVTAGALAGLDLAISRVALGKDPTAQRPLEARRSVLERLTGTRPWLRVVGAEVLELPEHLAGVSSSAARAGHHELIAPECRPVR